MTEFPEFPSDPETSSGPPRGIDRSAPVEGALVVHPVRSDQPERRDPRARLDEAVGLAEALDLQIRGADLANVRQPRPGTLFGKGKVQEIGDRAAELHCEVVVVDDALSPVQQRNLEKAWNAKVIDRTGLILEIFARRARTAEGKLQVELARLDYERSRLVRTWTHLERQRGGLGKTGGPGETQIELDRRLIADRIAKLKRELEEVRRTRSLHRSARKRVPYPTLALVGYTNAGKSTLFNRLTGGAVLAKDMLFATLDPTRDPCACRTAGRRSCPTPWASSPTCRTSWWPPSAPPWRRCRRPMWCCTCATSRPRTPIRRPPTWTRCWPRSASRSTPDRG